MKNEKPMEERSLFFYLQQEKHGARENFMAAMTQLEPVYRICAEDAADADYAAPEKARCWDCMFASPQYEAAKKAAAAYLVHPFRRNRGTLEYILEQDPSRDAEDLFLICYEHVLRRLVKVFRNVASSYKSRKGMVSRAEGYALYVDSMVSGFLIDTARTYNSGYGRSTAPKAPADLYDQGQPVSCPEELQAGMRVVRRSSRVGVYSGLAEMNGRTCAVVVYEDGRDYIPLHRVPETLRIFRGILTEEEKAPREQFRQQNRLSPLSLEEYLGDEESLTLMKLVAAAGSCEELCLENDSCRMVRRGFLRAMEQVRGDFAKSLMLMYYVMDTVRNELTHTDRIRQNLLQQDPMGLMEQIHMCSCLMLNIAASGHDLSIDPATIRSDFTAKELTSAKNKAKSILRLSIQRELAA